MFLDMSNMSISGNTNLKMSGRKLEKMGMRIRRNGTRIINLVATHIEVMAEAL